MSEQTYMKLGDKVKRPILSANNINRYKLHKKRKNTN